MALLDIVKLSLGISHTKLDTDIQESIDACKLDLGRVGVRQAKDTDPLIVQAIKLFCKWQYNFQGQADRYERAYSGLRDSMALCGDYNEVAADEKQ